jgi:hypothetical protein
MSMGVATGIRGSMKSRAVSCSTMKRSTMAAGDSKYGKQREPLLRVTGQLVHSLREFR